jgi:DNA-binding phage protein
MSDITREQLSAYLDDALSEKETARVEQALRDSETLRRSLRQAIQERDRGEHSLGAIWRRERLTCPARQKLDAYLREALDEDEQDYFRFHLETVGCRYCLANKDDLENLQKEPPGKAKERRKRIVQGSAGYLSTGRDG